MDTDVGSFLFKNHPVGLRYDPELAGRVALISFMTVAEVELAAVLNAPAPGSPPPLRYTACPS